jgi:hypothetical protein
VKFDDDVFGPDGSLGREVCRDMLNAALELTSDDAQA